MGGEERAEVDIAIVERRYYETGPTGAETRACIEVSDTTYRDDRRVKIPIYVAAGIPSWIVNIRERRVEAYATVEDLALPHGRVARDDETFAILGTTIAVFSILPPPRANGADDTSA
jgi:hypothetical protein